MFQIRVRGSEPNNYTGGQHAVGISYPTLVSIAEDRIPKVNGFRIRTTSLKRSRRRPNPALAGDPANDGFLK